MMRKEALMVGDDAGADAAPSTLPTKPRGRRPLTSPREELLNGPKHGGQAVVTGVGLPAPASGIPDAPAGPAEGTSADSAGRQGEHRTDDAEG
ncbi:hypothetical protein ACFYXW_18690 [Streptomyces sp. NPDC001981]|uniref:hypothetical protein n=1 Tax=Streptomyces sp. NPDC001981 TaxID=3364628 RepID=UPI003695A381